MRQYTLLFTRVNEIVWYASWRENSNPSKWCARKRPRRIARPSSSYDFQAAGNPPNGESPAASDISRNHQPDPRPFQLLLAFPSVVLLSLSPWRSAAVVCGSRVLRLDGQAGACSSKGKRIDPQSVTPACSLQLEIQTF
jgi:hypothetical protein